MSMQKIVLGSKNILLKPSYVQRSILARFLSRKEVTKNIAILSSDKNKELNKGGIQSQDKPLVVLLAWMLAKDKHINKYAQIYIDRGFDVLSVTTTPWQLLWPRKGSQLVADDVKNFLEKNYLSSPILLHGFSVGAYLWGEVLVKFAAELPKYQPLVVDRIIGQVWDSAADITEIRVGFPIAVFPKNPVMQATLRKYIYYHMKTFDKVATCHYLRSSQMFHTNLVKAPALFLLSKTDPIGAEASNQAVRENWESMGINVSWKCWDKSPHVGHFAKHQKEYLEELNSLLDKVYYNSAVQQRQANLSNI